MEVKISAKRELKLEFSFHNIRTITKTQIIYIILTNAGKNDKICYS